MNTKFSQKLKEKTLDDLFNFSENLFCFPFFMK